jgi:polysaccharide biosynthesis/export protein
LWFAKKQNTAASDLISTLPNKLTSISLRKLVASPTNPPNQNKETLNSQDKMRIRKNLSFQLIFVLILLPQVSQAAQESPRVDDPNKSVVSTSAAQSTYQLGPDDQLIFQGPVADDIVSKPFRIDPNGEMSIPMVGRLRAAGLTVQQFEDALNGRLAAFYKDPEIVVNVVEFRSQPVSVLGAVNQPGTHQLQGRKTLMEMISLAGGFRNDAGRSVTITRELQWGRLPLPNAKDDSSGKFSVGEISVQQLLEAKDPQANIAVMPRDVITVVPAQLVYVIGDVKRAGGFVLGERESMSVLQALALAEGLTNTADTKHARILHRTQNNATPTEVAVDVKKLLRGNGEDPQLSGGDVLFIPGSNEKKAGIRTAETILQTASGIAIWHF